MNLSKKKSSMICLLFLVFVQVGMAQNQSNQVNNLLKQGEVFLEDYEFEKALAVCNQALQKIQSAKRKSPSNLASVYYLYGRIYEKGLYLDKAIAALTTAIKFDSRNRQIYERRANIFEYIGKTEQAEADFEKAANLKEIKKNSDRNEITSIRSTVIGSSTKILVEYPETFQTIRFKEVADYVTKLDISDSDKDGKYSNSELVAGHVLHLFTLGKLVNFNPKSDLALWKRGDWLLHLNEITNQLFWISAETDFANAFDINPRYEYLVNRGVVRAKRDNKTNYEFSIIHFTDAIKLNDKCVEAFYNRGLSYTKLNENEKAIADFTEVMKLNANFVLAYKSRAKAFRAVGKINEAEADEAMLKKLGGK